MRTLRILAISHMHPLVDSPRYGIFITREMEYLAAHRIACDFLVPRPWAPWPLYLMPGWSEYRPGNRPVGPEAFRSEFVRYPRLPGFAYRRVEGQVAGHCLKPRARRWHRERAYDLVLGVSMIPDAEAAVVVARTLGLPVATLAVGSDVMVYPDRAPALWKRLGRTLEQVDLPIGVSRMLCQRMAETGRCTREPLCVYLGRDTAMFSPV